jgi:hypothetical protein
MLLGTVVQARGSSRTVLFHSKKPQTYPTELRYSLRYRALECFDADTGKDLAREICEYFIPDFSNWEDLDFYRCAFDQLLQDLKRNRAEGR